MNHTFLPDRDRFDILGASVSLFESHRAAPAACALPPVAAPASFNRPRVRRVSIRGGRLGSGLCIAGSIAWVACRGAA